VLLGVALAGIVSCIVVNWPFDWWANVGVDGVIIGLLCLTALFFLVHAGPLRFLDRTAHKQPRLASWLCYGAAVLVAGYSVLASLRTFNAQDAVSGASAAIALIVVGWSISQREPRNDPRP
jgi:hypothetical protein